MLAVFRHSYFAYDGANFPGDPMRELRHFEHVDGVGRVELDAPWRDQCHGGV